MVEWSPNVSVGSLIKNKLDKCFSAVVNLESFCFFGSETPTGLSRLTPDSRREPTSPQTVKPGPHNPLSTQCPCGQRSAWGDRFSTSLGLICYWGLISARSHFKRGWLWASLGWWQTVCRSAFLFPFLVFSLSEWSLVLLKCMSLLLFSLDSGRHGEEWDFALPKGLQSTHFSHTEKLQRLLSSYSVLNSVPGSSSMPHLIVKEIYHSQFTDE